MLIYSKISERSGHLAPRGACFLVIAFESLHLAAGAWDLPAPQANITPGSSWKGKDFSFSSSGTLWYCRSHGLAPDQRGGVGVGNWIWKLSQSGVVGGWGGGESLGKAAPPVRVRPATSQPGEGWSFWPSGCCWF